MQKFKNTFTVIPVLLILFMFTVNSNATIYDINIPLSGTQEVPPNASPGTGTLTGTYNDVTNTLVFSVVFSGLTGTTTAAHFHGPAAVGVNAGVRIGYTGFPVGITSGVYSNNFVLTASNETELLGNLWYANIHSSTFPGGELRGQVYAKPISYLDLTYFIEGFYNEGADTQVSDTIKVQLRNSTPPYALAYQNSGVVSSGGTLLLQYINISSGVYYIAVTHRNSIETWSSSGISIVSGDTETYNFSSGSTQAYGSNLIQVDAAPVRYAAYSADVNQDGTIDLTDGGLIDNDAFNFAGGYIPTDVNGDNLVDVADAVFADNNGFNFIGKITP
ncbi:MAG TPA: CHRD domain-containing protein [Ignavibacteria bacterium]|nr:CHRD domain-containing protein [Ignavibacteria bacterium]HRK00001.1 CHRD domain-containing protein [Ignavibacteria bacterium]